MTIKATVTKAINDALQVRMAMVDANSGKVPNLPTRDTARHMAALVRSHGEALGIKPKAPVKTPEGWQVAFSFGKTLSFPQVSQ